MRSCSPLLILLALSATPVAAQVKRPAPPATYHIDLRYQIATEENQRVREYRELTAALAKLGFVATASDDADLDKFNPLAERLAGTIPSKDARKVLDIGAIRTTILRPEGAPLPDDAKKPVQVRVQIVSGLDLAEQRLFHEQVTAQLGRLGFQEFTGYDHGNFSLIRGALPAGRVPELLRDLRDQPSGWFFSEIPREQLNLPLRDVLPVRLVEVLPDLDLGPVVVPPAPLLPEVESPKYSLDLRDYLADPATAGKPFRVELVLDGPLPEGALQLRNSLRLSMPTAAMEGVYGNFAVIRVMTTTDLVKLAQIPSVLSIRVPRFAAEQPGSAKANVSVQTALQQGNVSALHGAGYRGAGTRVVVLATDFAGADKLLGTRLPKAVQFLDLTAELSPTVEPTPMGTGVSGTETAAAVHAAAPDAELILVRLDPVAIHQLLTVAKTVLGDTAASIAVQTRADEMTAEAERLTNRRDLVEAEYRKAFNDLSDDEKPAKRRANATEAFKKLLADEKVFKATSDRIAAIRAKLLGLRGANVIVNTLVWEDGYAHDALSEVSRLLDAKLAPQPTRSGLRALKTPTVPVWVQAGSTSLGSVWTGPFLDADGNGVMEFAAGTKATPGTWTPELNFLAMVGPDAKPTDTLPEGAKIRISVQWREPRHPDTDLTGQAAFPFTLKLLRQIDPAGEKFATDEFAVVARTVGMPTHVKRMFSAAIYEQILELAIPTAGRYALRVEGGMAQDSLVRTARHVFELSPRIYVTANDPATAAKGRLVFTTYTPQASGVAIPGDATTVVTVGIVNGLVGAGPGILLRVKPDLFVQDVASPDSATGVVAGVVACLAEAGVQPSGMTRLLTPKPGYWLLLPTDWIRELPRKAVEQR
ncbi:hypothetical protein [Limnoglobus roseus]|uniref:Uncharacterized protein n=1 Tax=Limnoglobus roseus TaxID=2598579 RepID=A0A5C1API6_9BACT|nr:hypothetical protein [Limnoglobus roseus]QEL20067.1 hypothetical protein PX52LOC_07153 [Limnoglobus roseus]